MGEEIGITKGYPRIKKRIGRLSSYIQLVRPVTLITPLAVGILGTLAVTSNSVMIAIYVGVTLALCQATGQIINQYADIELDKIVKPYRPLPSGVLSKEEALGLAWLLALFSMARAFTISQNFGLGVLTLIFFSVFYSLSPFSPRKINPILNTAWMAISRGFIPVILIWSLGTNILEGLPYAILAFVWVMGFQSTKDINDYEADQKFNIKTIVGSYNLTKWMIAWTIIYILISLYLRLFVMLAIIPIAYVSIKYCNVDSKFTENTVGWLGFYSGLGMIYVLMLLSQTFF